MGIDQFWSYVEANPELYKPPSLKNPHRWGIGYTLDLVCKYLFPWITPKTIDGHIKTVKKKNPTNPICEFFRSRKVPPTKHVLLPYNPELTLYEQPEAEMPKFWVRYLSKSSKRFTMHIYKKRRPSLIVPQGVEVVAGSFINDQPKQGFPIYFNKEVSCNPIEIRPVDKIDINISVEPTTREKQQQEVTVEPVIIMDTQHCSCCGLLRSISKYRQWHITQYLKKFKVTMQCPCRSVRHPKVTDRLRILLSYYKRKETVVFRDLQRRLDALQQPTVRDFAAADDAQDREFVSSFIRRLLLRQNKLKNSQIKRSMFNILSRFNPDDGDPVKLMDKIYEVCGVDLVDMYKEFLGFLSPDQADTIDKFREYFISNCMEELIKKIEDVVTDRGQKLAIFKYLSTLSRGSAPSCVICYTLMDKMRDYPQLASYCFSLFPHRRKMRIVKTGDFNEVAESTVNYKPTVEAEKQNVIVNGDISEENILKNFKEEQVETKGSNVTKSIVTNGDVSEMDESTGDAKPTVEAENVSKHNAIANGDILEKNISKNLKEKTVETEGSNVTKSQLSNSELLDCVTGHNDRQQNNEEGLFSVQLEADCEDKPDEFIKVEFNANVEEAQSLINHAEEDLFGKPHKENKVWKRDEDKIVLEVLKESLSPAERLDKSVIEIIEEKKIPQIIINSLTGKSLYDVRNRIDYLLNLLEFLK